MFVAGETGGPVGNLHPDQFIHVQLHAPQEDPLARVKRLAGVARGKTSGSQQMHDAATLMFAGHPIAQNQLRTATVQRTVNAY